jgi:DNA-binding Lrp family transcriptional regulator
MKGREIIKAVMEKNGESNADLASKLNISPAALWDRLNSKKVKDIPVSLLQEMLRVMNYKVIIVPRSTRLPSDGYEVE